MSEGRVIVISGASGVGKGTVLKQMLGRCPELQFSVSATTRPPRESEEAGKDYLYVTQEEFQDMIQKDYFLEYDNHNKTWYGTPRAQMEEKLHTGDVLLDIDPNGAKRVREKIPEATLIFIMPPSMEELERRLRGRGDTSEEQIQIRLKQARWEMEQRFWYDHVVVNDTVEQCADDILNILGE